MHTRLASLALAGLAAAVFAQGGKQPTPQPPAAPAIAPAAQPAPKGIPVPDGPVVKKQELEGGIIAEDLKLGDGYEVKPGDSVVANYHGTLKDGGKIFDSSFDRGEPISFPLNGVIPGWQKGVPGMKVGGVRRLTIPAAMAYGEEGAGDDIPPNADLIFVIQLVDAMLTEDLVVGKGDTATGNCVAVASYVIRDKDGKELEKVDASKPYIWFPGEYQPVQFGVDGMKVGGKRKLTVPKEMNICAPAVQTSRPQNVPVTMEIELIAVRNVPRRSR